MLKQAIKQFVHMRPALFPCTSVAAGQAVGR